MWRKFRACNFQDGQEYFDFLCANFSRKAAIQIANSYLDSQRGEATEFCRQLYRATQAA